MLNSTMSTYDRFKRYEVKANSLEDFFRTYGREDRYFNRGEEYMRVVYETAKEELEMYGFTYITPHNSKCGDTVSYYL